MSFDKKWSQLSEEEKASAMSEHGSRKSWQDAKARSQGYQNREERTKDIKHISDQESKAYDMEGTVKTSNGQVAAYTGDAAATRWEELQKNRQMKEKQQAKAGNQVEKLAAHAAANGGKMGDRWNKITANMSTQERNDLRRQVAERSKGMKQESARAYQEFNRDRAAFKKESGSTGQRKVDQRAHYENLQKTKGGYGGSQAHQNAVAQLMSTGQKFSNLDVQREMGSASKYNMDGLYKAYGGYENYMENHSVGSGNWQSRIPQDQLGTMKEADDSQRQYFSDQNAMFKGMKEKYGQYDWFNSRRKQAKKQGKRFNQSFDRRAERMQGRSDGNIYGY